jgi:hypothetical protein
VTEGTGGEPCATEVCFEAIGAATSTQCMRAFDYPDCP